MKTAFEEMLIDPDGTDIEESIQARIDHLPEEDRMQARWNIGAENLIDFSDLCTIGIARLFDEIEQEEFAETLKLERYAKNDGAISAGREVEKIQGRFLRAAMKEEAEKAPENIRDFEAALKKIGFSTRAAKKIAVDGFKSGVAETVAP
ncbi:MAG: hypothetical protein HN368_13650 [Spirochaetales bacterium]|jgi:hypothetical protein|nr:hypothetical protein [Spirochaetales bacterium]